MEYQYALAVFVVTLGGILLAGKAIERLAEREIKKTIDRMSDETRVYYRRKNAWFCRMERRLKDKGR